ncbi:hypothetical protein SCHPADRAFT_914280 [Schizopora paradoxa]|uniref:Uncharacterized protein n=1 Tax=Schizopora paradoxa TaxID=27342 RepID=A0A0H2S2C3_9AGAM|nr:hypothetical protein SCHPADRAFT_914280 [Schizopora paradoxa]
MEPPTQREIELEMLLREREKQVAELTDEVYQLRKYLANQNPPLRSESVSLPPPLLSLLQPYVSGQQSPDAQRSGSSTMTAGLIQRTRVLQEENDELYELLRTSETGKLKEEVRCLKNVITRMERALGDSNNAITTLSDELEKSQKEFLSRQNIEPRNSRRDSPSPPRHEDRSVPPGSPNSHKAVPTGPRAHKKPRLNDNDARLSPARSNVSVHVSNSTLAPVHSNRASRHERSPHGGSRSRRSPTKEHRMDVDVDQKSSHRSKSLSRDRSRDHQRERDHEREKEREREHQRQRDRERERAREKDHDRDRDRANERHRDRERDRSKRNGTHSHGGRGSGGGGGKKGAARSTPTQDNGDRTLAERMGL